MLYDHLIACHLHTTIISSTHQGTFDIKKYLNLIKYNIYLRILWLTRLLLRYPIWRTENTCCATRHWYWSMYSILTVFIMIDLTWLSHPFNYIITLKMHFYETNSWACKMSGVPKDKGLSRNCNFVERERVRERERERERERDRKKTVSEGEWEPTGSCCGWFPYRNK